MLPQVLQACFVVTLAANGRFKQKRVFFIKGGGILLRASTTQSRFSIWGQKLGRALIKNPISRRFFIPDFHCQMENNKTQRGGARSAPPLWGGAEGAALLFSIWQWKPGIKNRMEIVFLFRPGPTFGPELKTDFGWCWPLIKPPGALTY